MRDAPSIRMLGLGAASSQSLLAKSPYCRDLSFMYKETERERRPTGRCRIGLVGSSIVRMKTDAVFKRAFNDALDLVSRMVDGAPLPPETALSATLGISRTTVRKIITTLAEQGVVAGDGRERTIRARSNSMRRFPEAETVSTSAQVEKRFMEWMLRDDASPGMTINELELARQFGVGTTGIREFLNRFQSFGLIEKRPNAGWLFKGFTINFALELFEIREMFELRSAVAFASLPKTSPLLAGDRGIAPGASKCFWGYRSSLPRLFRPRQPVSSPCQLSGAQSICRRLLRPYHLDFPLPLPMEQARRATTQ